MTKKSPFISSKVPGQNDVVNVVSNFEFGFIIKVREASIMELFAEFIYGHSTAYYGYDDF